MIHLHDLTDRTLPDDLPADATMRQLLATTLADLDDALLAWTEIVVVQPGDTERDMVSALGFNPLDDPYDGHRWADPRYHPGWDHITRIDGAYRLTFSFGSTFGQIVFVETREDALGDLCRHYGGPERGVG